MQCMVYVNIQNRQLHLLDTCRCGVVLATSLTWKAIGILFTCCSVKVQLTENIPNVTNTADHCRRWSHIVFIRESPLYSWGNDPVRHGAVFLNAYLHFRALQRPTNTLNVVTCAKSLPLPDMYVFFDICNNIYPLS